MSRPRPCGPLCRPPPGELAEDDLELVLLAVAAVAALGEGAVGSFHIGGGEVVEDEGVFLEMATYSPPNTPNSLTNDHLARLGARNFRLERVQSAGCA